MGGSKAAKQRRLQIVGFLTVHNALQYGVRARVCSVHAHAMGFEWFKEIKPVLDY